MRACATGLAPPRRHKTTHACTTQAPGWFLHGGNSYNHGVVCRAHQLEGGVIAGGSRILEIAPCASSSCPCRRPTRGHKYVPRAEPLQALAPVRCRSSARRVHVLFATPHIRCGQSPTWTSVCRVSGSPLGQQLHRQGHQPWLGGPWEPTLSGPYTPCRVHWS